MYYLVFLEERILIHAANTEVNKICFTIRMYINLKLFIKYNVCKLLCNIGNC